MSRTFSFALLASASLLWQVAAAGVNSASASQLPSKKTQKHEWNIVGRVTTLKGEPVHGATVRVDIGAGPDLVKTVATDLKGGFEADFSLDANSYKTLSVKITAAKPDYLDAREAVDLESPGRSRRIELVLPESSQSVYELSVEALLSSIVPRVHLPGVTGSPSGFKSEDGAQNAQELLARGNAAQALPLLQKAVEREPACISCRTLLGLALLEEGSWSSAIREFTRAIGLSAAEKDKTRTLEPFVILGVLETRRGRLRRAAIFLLQALEMEPTNPLALQELGRVCVLGGRMKAAAQYLQKAIKAGAPGEAHFLRAKALLDEGEPREAEAEMQAFLAGRKAKELPHAQRLEWLRMEARLQIESRGKTPTVVDVPLAELVEKIPDLKGLQSATTQDERALILRKVGEGVKAFFEGFPNTSSLEEVAAQHLNSNGKVKESVRRKFKYLLLSQSDRPGLGLEEYRTDLGGNSAVTQAFGSQYMITEGFASQSLHLHPAHQFESRFRYLGRQSVNGVDTHVIAFAQRPEAATVLEDFRMKGASAVVLIQGTAWVDVRNYQVLRIRTDLLKPDPGIRLQRQTTDILFGDVRFERVKSKLSLPREVTVTVAWNGRIFRNTHRYSDFRLFNVITRQRLKTPKVALEAPSNPP